MELWIASCSFIGAIAGASVSAYLSGRLGESGKIDASISKLDALLLQVQQLTTATETIKTRLSADEWNRQWLLDRKRESYSALLQIFGEAWYRIDMSARLWPYRDDARVNANILRESEAFRNLVEDAIRKAIPAKVFINSNASAVVDRVVRLGFGPKQALDQQYFDMWTTELKTALNAMEQEARSELHL